MVKQATKLHTLEGGASVFWFPKNTNEKLKFKNNLALQKEKKIKQHK